MNDRPIIKRMRRVHDQEITEPVAVANKNRGRSQGIKAMESHSRVAHNPHVWQTTHTANRLRHDRDPLLQMVTYRPAPPALLPAPVPAPMALRAKSVDLPIVDQPPCRGTTFSMSARSRF